MPRPAKPIPIRIGRYGCWLWQGATTRDYAASKSGLVHRLVYAAAFGPITPGMVIDHLCEVPGCVNPLHLRETTQAVNVARAHRHTTHCPKGHAFTEHAGYRNRRGRRQRYCLACNRERVARHKNLRLEGA